MYVKNHGCIRRLSFRMLRARKKRDLIAVSAIALTTLLFTALFTIVLSINETHQNYQFRAVGTYAHGSFKDVDGAQTAALAAHPKVKASGRRTVIGLCTQGAFEKDYGEVSFMDDAVARWSYCLPTVGRLPQRGREVAMDTRALSLLGVTPEVGAKVTLSYALNDHDQTGETVTDTFTLVGWWEHDELLAVHFINVSEEYVRQIEDAAKSAGMGAFRTDLTVMLSSSIDIEGALTQIAGDCGYAVGEDAGQLRIGVNWGYTATQIAETLDAGTILAILTVGILVIFTGYLVIDNIFQISVAEDIRFYGLLKTIGVTPRQLRRIIRHQALALSAAGIPLGALLGYGVGVLAVPAALSASTFGNRYTTISLSPWIFLGAALFSLLTVLLSCARPGRMAGKVSPVEAVGYAQVRPCGAVQRAPRRVTPFSMAWANLGRDRRRSALVVVSLSLAVVLFDLLATFLIGFDMEKYLAERSSADFLVSTPNYFRYQGCSLTTEDIRPILANTERTAGGFAYGATWVQMYLPERVWRDQANHYFRGQDIDALLRSAQRRGEGIASYAQAEGLEDALLEKLTVVAGDLSPMRRPGSDAVAVAVRLDGHGALPDPENYPAVGEQVTVTYGPEDARHDAVYTVCALVDIPHDITSRYHSMGHRILLHADTLLRDAGTGNVYPMFYLFDVPTPQAEAAAEAYLSQLTTAPASPLMYESKATHRAYFREFQTTFALLGGLLCAIVAVVGILNFFNAVMTSLLSRRREFAVLEAVGQTKRQLRAMAIGEGLLYTLGSGGISLLLSAALGPLAGRLLERAYWFYTYRCTVAPALLVLPVFALIGAAVPTVLYRHTGARSIVERLRTSEL